MDYAFVTSLCLNFMFYFIVAILTFRLIVIAGDDNKPLMPDQQQHYLGFMIFMSIIWPVFYISLAITQAEEMKEIPIDTQKSDEEN